MHPRNVRQMFHFPCVSRGWGHLVMHGLVSIIIKVFSARGSLQPAAPHVLCMSVSQTHAHVVHPHTHAHAHTQTLTDTHASTETHPHTSSSSFSFLTQRALSPNTWESSFLCPSVLFIPWPHVFNQKLSPSVSPTPASVPLLQFRPWAITCPDTHRDLLCPMTLPLKPTVQQNLLTTHMVQHRQKGTWRCLTKSHVPLPGSAATPFTGVYLDSALSQAEIIHRGFIWKSEILETTKYPSLGVRLHKQFSKYWLLKCM